jgi:Fe-S-cluster containining protein
MHNQTETKKNLPIPLSAKAVHKKIVAQLRKLVALDVPSAVHPEFAAAFNSFLSLFQDYQQEIMNAYDTHNTCSRGCSHCCYHWVEDVYSFEAQIIAQYIKTHFSRNIPTIIDTFRQDELHFVNVARVMEQKLLEHGPDEDLAGIDTTDLLLASYYQLKRPCALLARDRTCSIYSVRPLTCRMYMSFSPPEQCKPEYINEANIPTYLLDVEENASKLLDTLHEKYRQIDKSGLRAVLIDYLA